MIDSLVTPAQARTPRTIPSASPRWLLLLHQIPPKPDYLRVKVRRRLQRIGAVPLKSSVYVLPAGDESREDFEWLRREIVADGGEAVVCEAALVAGTTDDALIAQFRADRAEEFREIARNAAAAGRAPELARLRHRLEEAMSIDYFGTAERESAERAVDAATSRLRGESAAADEGVEGRPRGATWVTRQGVKVDRMASAWLIRRFIDPDAHFRFVPAADARSFRPGANELRFDMYQGEFTHQGEWCTFETLLAHFPPSERAASRALAAIAEIVHDIDLKEARFDRPETAGVAAMVAGIVAAGEDDVRRLERGAELFESLFASFGGPRAKD